MKSDRLTSFAVFCGLVTLAVTVRLVSETPNFGAVTAAALFAGFYFRQRITAICVPMTALVISDQFLGGYNTSIMLVVYGSYLIPIAWRNLLRERLTPGRVAAGALSSSLVFYVATNAAVWYVWHPHTLASLVHCYSIALPFFVNTMASDALFAAGVFGLYALAVRTSSAHGPVVASAAA